VFAALFLHGHLPVGLDPFAHGFLLSVIFMIRHLLLLIIIFRIILSYHVVIVRAYIVVLIVSIERIELLASASHLERLSLHKIDGVLLNLFQSDIFYNHVQILRGELNEVECSLLLCLPAIREVHYFSYLLF